MLEDNQCAERMSTYVLNLNPMLSMETWNCECYVDLNTFHIITILYSSPTQHVELFG